MIWFRLFKVPVQISSISWIGLALLAFFWCAFGMMSFLMLFLFLLALGMTMLVHELGHALVGRYFGGGAPSIHLGLFSGYCENKEVKLTQGEHILMVVAGSVVTLCWGSLAFVVLSFVYGGVAPAWEFAVHHVFYESYGVSLSPDFGVWATLLISFLSACIWWSTWGTIFNLLPIYPSDGGRIFMLASLSRRKTFLAGYVVSICLGLVLLLGGFCVPFSLYLFFCAVENRQRLKPEAL